MDPEYATTSATGRDATPRPPEGRGWHLERVNVTELRTMYGSREILMTWTWKRPAPPCENCGGVARRNGTCLGCSNVTLARRGTETS